MEANPEKNLCREEVSMISDKGKGIFFTLDIQYISHSDFIRPKIFPACNVMF